MLALHVRDLQNSRWKIAAFKKSNRRLAELLTGRCGLTR